MSALYPKLFSSAVQAVKFVVLFGGKNIGKPSVFNFIKSCIIYSQMQNVSLLFSLTHTENSSVCSPFVALYFQRMMLSASLMFACLLFFGCSLEENEEGTDINGPATTVGVSFYHLFVNCFQLHEESLS